MRGEVIVPPIRATILRDPQTCSWLRARGTNPKRYAAYLPFRWHQRDPAKAFHCRHGKAYLFRDVVNVTLGEKEERMMITGMHIVADIFCVRCGSIVGWKYESAYEKSQKYKEGKFILERFKVLGPDGSTYQGIPEAQLAESDADEE